MRILRYFVYLPSPFGHSLTPEVVICAMFLNLLLYVDLVILISENPLQVPVSWAHLKMEGLMTSRGADPITLIRLSGTDINKLPASLSSIPPWGRVTISNWNH